MSNLKFRFDTWKTYTERIGEMLLNDDNSISPIFKKDEENFIKFKKIMKMILSNIKLKKDLQFQLWE